MKTLLLFGSGLNFAAVAFACIAVPPSDIFGAVDWLTVINGILCVVCYTLAMEIQ